MPDALSVILRSASFVALFQAAGMALFAALFGRLLDRSSAELQRLTLRSAFAAGVLLMAHYVLEAARMAGDLSGVLDPSLQMLAMHSASSTVLAVRLLALVLIASTAGRRGVGGAVGIIGAALVAVSFVLTGHTAASPWRWALAPLLVIHVMIVTYWFGALVPLFVICTRESPAIAARATAAFSRVALWLVPGIFGAGVLLGLILIRHLAEFRTGYGISLLGKFLGFVALMALAALNKWRFAPAIVSGDARAFRRSLVAEYVLIAVVLSITAVMTTFYSPEP